ncbi:MAG TPA: endolytic transglycosylase MltG [Ignavibacteria bacterium]|nr:endolytic transglycosylase MltG [Ignavibacteria bacterium]
MSFINDIKKYYRAALLVNILLIVFIGYQLYYSKYYWLGDDEKVFTIEPGKNLDEIISGLKNADIISNSFLFKLAVKLSFKENQIISRGYLFKNGMNNSELITILTDKYSNPLIKITIPPGYNLRQIGKIVEKKLSLSKEKFMKEASSDSLINILGLSGQIKNLEGFLYPDTYEVSPVIKEKALVNLMFNEFREKILDDSEIQSQIAEQETTLLKTLTLASIIDGETRINEERPVIAGVYLNRLKKGMRLEADPTVQYILPDGPKPRLLFEDLKIVSPYNTYLYKGLPPGPINNPGLSSIKAALNPAKHNFIFFVATGEGGHKFTENYEDHQKAVKEYKAKLKEKQKQQQK